MMTVPRRENMTIKQTITSFKLSATWSDGKTEGLAIDLPEYLYDELQAYFRELEDLREEHDNNMRDEEYSFGEDDLKEIK
jgi:DNA replication initiation complex subunit (GINS family)